VKARPARDPAAGVMIVNLVGSPWVMSTVPLVVIEPKLTPLTSPEKLKM
jgi:hypothetical protein